MRLFTMTLGSVAAIALTVLAFSCLNMYSNPSFEPFFSPWPWFIIYAITNVAQLLIMTIIVFGVSKIFKFSLSTAQLRYFLVGFIYSAVYVIGQTFITTKVEELNNYLFVFAIYPVVIYVCIVYAIKLIENKRKTR
jgi:VanZ family protein